jgi:putative flippase GtrA
MRQFLKAQMASLIASVTDFLTTVLLVEVFRVWYLAASISGTIVGGIVHFTVSRKWVFKADEGKLLHHIGKYILGWAGNLILNAAGVYVMTSIFHVNYMISKIVVSILVAVFYNFFVQKNFVFR